MMMRRLDIPALRTLVPASHQNDDRALPLRESAHGHGIAFRPSGHSTVMFQKN